MCVVDWMSVGFSHASEKFSLYVFFGKVVASHRSELSVAMGSLDPGTLCAYCGKREAQYIPDGAVGPMCLVGKASCGLDNWDAVIALRLRRCWNMVSAQWTSERAGHRWKPVFARGVVSENIASYLWCA